MYSFNLVTVLSIESANCPISFSDSILISTSRFPSASCCATSFKATIGFVMWDASLWIDKIITPTAITIRISTPIRHWIRLV